MHLKKCKHKIITTYPTNTDIEYHTPFFPTDTTNEMITDRTKVEHENYSSHHEANNYPTRSSLSPNFQELEQEPFDTTINCHQPTYRSLRTKRTFTYLEDYICQQASFHSSQNYDKNKGLHNLGNHFPLTTTTSNHSVSNNHKVFITSINTHIEPNMYQEALASPDWYKAMSDEITTLEMNNT